MANTAIGLRHKIDLLKVAEQVYLAQMKLTQTQIEMQKAYIIPDIERVYNEICRFMGVDIYKNLSQHIIGKIKSGDRELIEAIKNIE